jgi:DNA-binding transcriptional ArsR family regulator
VTPLGRLSKLQGANRDVDILETLRELGEATVDLLVLETGRSHAAIRESLVRLRRARLVVRLRPPRRRRAWAHRWRIRPVT